MVRLTLTCAGRAQTRRFPSRSPAPARSRALTPTSTPAGATGRVPGLSGIAKRLTGFGESASANMAGRRL